MSEKTVEQLHAEWCAARGVSDEAERKARKAYDQALKAAAKAEKATAPKKASPKK